MSASSRSFEEMGVDQLLPKELLSLILVCLDKAVIVPAEKIADDALALKPDSDATAKPVDANFLVTTDGNKTTNTPNQYQYQNNLNFLCNIAALYSNNITHNLVWLIHVESTLLFAKENPQSLDIAVEIKDPYGQRILAKPLQAVAAAGDFNTRAMKPEEKPYGLVERLRPCFPNPNAHATQLTEWFKPDAEAATKKILNPTEEILTPTEITMKPYVTAIETTCQRIIDSKEITDDLNNNELLALPIAIQLAADFKQALTPDPKHVVTSGFLFDMQIFLKLTATFETNADNDKIKDKARPNLGGMWSRKSNLLDAIIYPHLQARSQRCDIGIFKTGIGNVADGQIPERLDYSVGDPTAVMGLGVTHFFGFFGTKFAGRRGGDRVDGAALVVSNLVSNKKQQQLELCKPSVPHRASA
jgi:hypothetical protein